MRSTHGYSICSHFHLCVKNSHRNLKCGISVFVHRLIFFAIHDHVIVIRAAPDDGCCSFFVFDLYFGRRFYRCSSGSACEGYIELISSVFQFQIFQLFSLRFLVIGSFLIFGSICFFCVLLVGGVFFFVCIISCFFHITCLYRIFDADFMVIPFTFFSQKCHIKFLTNGRYRDIKPVNFLCITVAVFYCICGRFNDLGAILLCIFCSSCKQIYDLLGNQAYMDGHLAIFDRKLSFFVIGLIYMEHTAVCVKLCCINTIF